MASYAGARHGKNHNQHHGRLHKRAGSSSSVQSPSLTPALEHYPSEYKGSNEHQRATRYTDEQWEVHSRGQNKIRPYLRKLSSRDDNRIDLSRTTEENERIAGLGISDYTGMSKSVSDVTFIPVSGGGRSRHGRTTSSGSQFSTASLQKPTAPYTHPMRQTPRPYTPPIAKSYTTSARSNDSVADEATNLVMPDEHSMNRPRFFSEPHTRAGSNGSSFPYTNPPPPLQLHTSSSFTRLNASQSSFHSSLPTGGRSRGDTLRSVDTMNSPASASGRTSLDKAVSFIHRSKTGSNSMDDLDPERRRVESIRALREKYNVKEEAKEAKYASKLARRENHRRRKSDATAGATGRDESEKLGDTSGQFVGRNYADYNATHLSSLPRAGSRRPGSGGLPNQPIPPKKPGAKSTWVRFLAWLRTRFLRAGSTVARETEKNA